MGVAIRKSPYNLSGLQIKKVKKIQEKRNKI